MGVRPILIDAAIFGWVQRRRLYWAAGPDGADVAWQTRALPSGVELTWQGDRSAASYKGKPIPRSIRTLDGFRWYVKEPEQVVKDGGEGAMYPVTGEFPRPNEPAAWDTVRR